VHLDLLRFRQQSRAECGYRLENQIAAFDVAIHALNLPTTLADTLAGEPVIAAWPLLDSHESYTSAGEAEMTAETVNRLVICDLGQS
jgi:hypothetical protein